MSANLYDAHRQWVKRPPDERFASLDELQQFVTNRRAISREYPRALKSLATVSTPAGGIAVNGEMESAYLTHWAFSQLCVTVGAPSRYLRSLPPPLVMQCLDYTIRQSSGDCKLLVRNATNGGVPSPMVGAVTGPNYGRIWDAEVVETIQGGIEGTGWQPAPDVTGRPSGLYASDRDVFLFLVCGETPVEVEGSRLGRGFFCWNSETGAASFGLTTFLYNYVCGNHIVWGAEQVRELRIEHRDQALQRFHKDALPMLERFLSKPSLNREIEGVVSRAAKVHVGNDAEETLGWFKNKPFTRSEINAAWEVASNSRENPSTLWGMVQGLTGYARTLSYTNARVALERRAGALLSHVD